MARKFGKKNVIKVDPLAYNIGFIGEGGIGKTTLAKEICERLAGEDSYIVFNIGKEDGIDAIADIMYEDVEDWDTLSEIAEDIIENKMTDYKELKVVIYDTYDELISIAEAEAIRLWNRANPEKRTQSINAAWGGFGKGEKKAIELILDVIWRLKKVGVSMFVVGHTKRKTKTDIETTAEYEVLTTNVQQNYFNAIKDKLHLLAVASIDREIVKVRTGKKDIKGKEIIKGEVSSEARKITFRDDNFNIESKSRFAEIVGTIEFSAEAFIAAMTNAIKAERDKSKTQSQVSSEDAAKAQEKEKEEEIRANVQKEKDIRDAKSLEKNIKSIEGFIKHPASKTKMADQLKAVALKLKDLGKKPKELTLEETVQIIALIKG